MHDHLYLERLYLFEILTQTQSDRLPLMLPLKYLALVIVKYCSFAEINF